MDTLLIYILISNFINFSIPVFFYYKVMVNIGEKEYTRYIILTFIAFIIVTIIDYTSSDYTYFFINSVDIYNDHTNVFKYIIILLISIYPLLFKGISLAEKIFWILSLNVMISIINTFCITLLLSVFGYDAIISTNGFGYEKIISIIIIRVVQIFFIYIFSKNIVFTKYVNKKILFILCIICVLNQLISSVILRDILIKSYNRTILTTIYVCSIFIVQIQSFYMLNIVSKEMQRLFVLDMTLKSKQNDEDIIRMYKEMRGLRHDFKNHISAILALIERGAKESSIRYIYELDNKISKFDKYVYTENIAIDSILANKIKIAKEKNIDINLEIDIKTQINIPDIDMCTILGNLIDNSIEACEKLETEKIINMRIVTKGNNIIIKIRNNTNGKLKEHDGRFITTKSYGTHGIGLDQIDSIVRKYGGYISRKHENNIFDTSILMQCNNF